MNGCTNQLIRSWGFEHFELNSLEMAQITTTPSDYDSLQWDVIKPKQRINPSSAVNQESVWLCLQYQNGFLATIAN